MDKILEQIMEVDAMLNESKTVAVFSESPWDDVLENIDKEEQKENLSEGHYFDKFMDDLTLKEAKNAQRFKGKESPIREYVNKHTDSVNNKIRWGF